MKNFKNYKILLAVIVIVVFVLLMLKLMINTHDDYDRNNPTLNVSKGLKVVLSMKAPYYENNNIKLKLIDIDYFKKEVNIEYLYSDSIWKKQLFKENEFSNFGTVSKIEPNQCEVFIIWPENIKISQIEKEIKIDTND